MFVKSDQVAEKLIRMIEDLDLDRSYSIYPLGSMPHGQVHKELLNSSYTSGLKIRAYFAMKEEL